MSQIHPSVKAWTPAELNRRLGSGEDLLLLDLRSAAEYAAWRIESRLDDRALNVPYSTILETEGRDDPHKAIAAYAAQHLAGELAGESSIVTICARGVTSALAAQVLRGEGYQAVTLEGGMEAWAGFYDFRPVVETKDFALWQVIRPARGCLGYVIISDGEAAVIDPLRHVERYTQFALDHRLTIKMVLDTHSHADHISGGPALCGLADAPYYLHPYDGVHPVDVLPARITFDRLWEGMELSIGRSRIRTLHVPGHTLGNTAFLVDDDYLLTGDSIFLDSISRPDLGGHAESWTHLHYDSLRRLLDLPDHTLIMPGHFSTPKEATDDGLFARELGLLRQTNPGLQMAQRSREEFLSYILNSLPQVMPQYVEIKRVNVGLTTADDAAASALELGRNVCAMSQAHT